jgi:hypothetical protein
MYKISHSSNALTSNIIHLYFIAVNTSINGTALFVFEEKIAVNISLYYVYAYSILNKIIRLFLFAGYLITCMFLILLCLNVLQLQFISILPFCVL